MTQGFDDAVNGHKSNLTKSMKDFGEDGRIHHLLRDIDLNICDYEYYFNQGKKSQQAKIDSLDKNIEALHVEIERIQKEYQGMFEGVQGRQKTINELKAKYDELNNRATGVALDQMATAKLNCELQARVDETLKILKGWDDQSYRDDMDQLIGEIEDILKGNQDEK